MTSLRRRLSSPVFALPKQFSQCRYVERQCRRYCAITPTGMHPPEGISRRMQSTDVCGGCLRIAGTRLTVSQLVVWYKAAFQRVVSTQNNSCVWRHWTGDETSQQDAAGLVRGPQRPVQDAMLVRGVAFAAQSHRPQGGCHGTCPGARIAPRSKSWA